MTDSPEPYWRLDRWPDAFGRYHEQWQPSAEMQYLLGCQLSMQADIESATLLRPTLILLPPDKVPDAAKGGGYLMGVPFAVSDQVTEMSLVYPVRQRPLDLRDIEDRSSGSVEGVLDSEGARQ